MLVVQAGLTFRGTLRHLYTGAKTDPLKNMGITVFRAQPAPVEGF